MPAAEGASVFWRALACCRASYHACSACPCCGGAMPPGSSHLQAWGKCDQPFMAAYCAQSCGRCGTPAPTPACMDVPPPGGYTCQQQKVSAACGHSRCLHPPWLRPCPAQPAMQPLTSECHAAVPAHRPGASVTSPSWRRIAHPPAAAVRRRLQHQLPPPNPLPQPLRHLPRPAPAPMSTPADSLVTRRLAGASASESHLPLGCLILFAVVD